MSWISGLRRRCARVEVRVALVLFCMYAPAIAVVLAGQLAYEVRELLEMASRNARGRLVEIERELGEPRDAARTAELEVLGADLAREGLGYRIADGADGILDERGLRADTKRLRPPRGLLLDAIFLRATDQLRLDGVTPAGRPVTLVVSMERFAIERAELVRATVISLAVGVALAMVLSAVATRRVLRPLREATRSAEAIDLDRLDARLALRGTNDDVDRHAAALNRVLGRLEAGFRRIQDFNHDVAHELRTPINRILSAAEVSLLARRAEPETAHALEVIRESAERMGQIVDALLLLAREGEGSVGRRSVAIETGAIFEALETAYAPAFDEKGIRLEVTNGSVTVHGDPTLLLRALANLLDNALRHTPLGGVVRLDQVPESGTVSFRVSDSGPGVPIADRTRIFERFVRLGEAREPGSSGLGLPIAEMIARVHGGGLTVETSSFGGACFELRLPRPVTSC